MGRDGCHPVGDLNIYGSFLFHHRDNQVMSTAIGSYSEMIACHISELKRLVLYVFTHKKSV